MKQQILSLYILSGVIFQLSAQSTGNVIYNSNNRFYQNSSYKSSGDKKYKSSSPTVNSQIYHFDFGDGTQSGTYQNANETVIRIDVLYNAKPSAYMAIFHINQAGKKISDLDTLVSRRVNKFMEMARSIGIGKDQFYMDMIALVPIFEQGKRNTTKPRGFELQKNIHVKYTNPAHLDRLFSMAAQCEIYDLIKVEYLFDDAEKAGLELQAKALELLGKKVVQYQKMGVKLDTAYRSVYESGSVIFPIDRYKPYQPLAVSSLEEEDKPGTGEELMKTSAGIIQRSTVFYNPEDCSGYDAVINPSPLEPPIQFTYSLLVRYNRIQPVKVETQTEKIHEIMIVTPAGDVKTIVK